VPGLGRTLIAGGIPLAEVTFRTSVAAETIRALKGEIPGILVGAGASFVVSPCWDDAVVDFCLERGVAKGRIASSKSQNILF
jgi:2-dehydro-3-deoxyphosphogluconate aldolase/(4S)-4-hydroxy-2-oxoglutarate aldolase